MYFKPLRSPTDLVLKRTHILLLIMRPGAGGLCALDLETLGHLEQVGHVGVLPGQEDGPVLIWEGVQVDEVGHDVPHEVYLTGSLQGLPAVDIERGQLVGGLYHVYPGCSV